jgi:hypothetical protein
MIISSDDELLSIISPVKNALLVEPNYTRKYPPLGLAKLSTWFRNNGATISYRRSFDALPHDLVCVTSLFTYEFSYVENVIRGITFCNPGIPILLGGPCATLLANKFSAMPNVTVFSGYSKILDLTPADWKMNWMVDEEWNKFSMLFTTRGCPNHCAYCAVWRIEKERWINPRWKEQISPSKPYVMISDNNLSACPIEHIEDVIKTIISMKKGVVFDNGFDCKHITPELAALLGGLRFVHSGMRMAFDRIEEDGIFQNAVKTLIKFGVSPSNIMEYCLFGFTDKPQDAHYRMKECQSLKIRPYPQRYVPLNTTEGKSRFTGKFWTNNLERAFRYYWLMAGINTKKSFEEFWDSPQAKQFNLREYDKEFWNAK